MAARRPFGRSHADFGGALGSPPQCGALCAAALQDAACRQSCRACPGAPDGDHGPHLIGVRRVHALPPARHQTPVRLFLHRAYGHHHVRLRHGRSARQLCRALAHDHAFPDEIGNLPRRRSRRAGQRYATHRRHGRPDRNAPRARMGLGPGGGCDCGLAAARDLYQRVSGRDLHIRALAVPRAHSRIRITGGICGAVPAAQYHCVRRTARRARRDPRILHSHVRPSRPCSRRRHLSAAVAGGMVSERRESIGLTMPALIDTIAGRKVDAHRPCPRFLVDGEGWRSVSARLAQGHWCLLGLWGDTGAVHMAVLDEAPSPAQTAVVSLDCPASRFPSVGALNPAAIRLERAIRSMFALEPVGLPDRRPWLDLGFWDIAHPLAAPPPLPSSASGWGGSAPYDFLPVEGEGLHQIPVGPVHAGIIEPGHFRFTANGETVVRLEQRLGYVHKGIEALMAGATLERAARLAGRTSGDSTVAYALAFAHAVESAWDMQGPPRALHLRALMAELERLANHFGDIGAICNDASFSLMHAQCGILREHTLRTADACFGHRLMMDCVVPGGLAADLAASGPSSVLALLDRIRRIFPQLIELYDNTASLQDRTATTGILSAALARQFGAGGYIGRASGRAFDARKTPGYSPYDTLEFEVPIMTIGDVNSRVWVRIREVEESMRLIEQILKRLPEGPILQPLHARAGMREGLGIVEGFRGDILVWIRLEADRVSRCHLRDPSWFQWPLLEAVIEGNIVADFPLCNKSFNCSYSGHDV